MKTRLLAILKLLGWFIWFTIALVFVTIGAGGFMGALTGDWITGVLVMAGGGLIIVFGELGRTMIKRMSIVLEDLQRAFTKAADSIDDDAKKK